MKSYTVLLFFTVLLVAAAVISATDSVPQQPDCTGNEGKSFTDGCNTCVCGKNSETACTLVLCVGGRTKWTEVAKTDH